MLACSMRLTSATLLAATRRTFCMNLHASVDYISPIGRSPVTETYRLDNLPEADENRCVIISGVEAVWGSGTIARVGPLANL